MAKSALLHQKKTDSFVIACFDFRLQPHLLGAVRRQYGVALPDIATRAGGAKDLASPDTVHHRFHLLEDVDLAVRFHRVRRIIILNHEDCGKYRASGFHFDCPKAERRFHEEELRKAGELIRSHVDGVKVHLGFVQFNCKTIQIQNVRF